jgi:hypothetical protein
MQWVVGGPTVGEWYADPRTEHEAHGSVVTAAE